MIEVRVQCPCGARFKFDVEPVHGLMPSAVGCPTCGQDVTELANADIHRKLPADPAPTAPSVTVKPQLRVASVAHPPASPSSAVPMPASAPMVVHAPATVSPAVARHFAPTGERSVWLGIGGALVGAFAGMMIWFLLIKWTQYEIGWIAWGIGVLAGFGARVTGASPTPTLGVFTAVCTCVAIIGGQFLAARSFLDTIVEESVTESYDERLAYAKAGVAAKTDDEIRSFLVQHGETEDGADGKPVPATAAQLTAFRETEQPQLQEFIDGKPSKEEFGREIRSVQDTPAFQFMLLKESFSLFTLLWLFLGMGSAYKIASGASGD